MPSGFRFAWLNSRCRRKEFEHKAVAGLWKVALNESLGVRTSSCYLRPNPAHCRCFEPFDGATRPNVCPACINFRHGRTRANCKPDGTAGHRWAFTTASKSLALVTRDCLVAGTPLTA